MSCAARQKKCPGVFDGIDKIYRIGRQRKLDMRHTKVDEGEFGLGLIKIHWSEAAKRTNFG
jgi:hypothetical protein